MGGYVSYFIISRGAKAKTIRVREREREANGMYTQHLQCGCDVHVLRREPTMIQHLPPGTWVDS